MKCPLCNAPTEIKEKRDSNGKVLRRRECYNIHVFMTEEIVVSKPRVKRQYTSQSAKAQRT